MYSNFLKENDLAFKMLMPLMMLHSVNLNSVSVGLCSTTAVWELFLSLLPHVEFIRRGSVNTSAS